MKIRTLLILMISFISISSTSLLIYSACCGQAQRELGTCPDMGCDWERLGGRCNSDSECCPGKQCSALGYCELCF